MNDQQIEAIARTCHFANASWRELHGQGLGETWEECPPTKRAGIIDGVKLVLTGATPEEMHSSWLAHKTELGWKYGPHESKEDKTHPCIRPYAELPSVDQAKDDLFIGIVRAWAEAVQRSQAPKEGFPYDKYVGPLPPPKALYVVGFSVTREIERSPSEEPGRTNLRPVPDSTKTVLCFNVAGIVFSLETKDNEGALRLVRACGLSPSPEEGGTS